MSHEEFRALIVALLFLLLVINGGFLWLLLARRAIEPRVTRLESDMALISGRMATMNAEMAGIRVETRAVAGSLQKIEHHLALIFEAAIEKAKGML
ncbi:hypothetical protein [Acidisoma sp. 7E03]